MWTKEKVAATIDHAVLKPSSTNEDVIKGCELGRKYNVASVCVSPTDVSLAAGELDGSEVKVSTVIGFPHGSNLSQTKALEAKLAIEDGARELDMVMNIGKFLSGDYEYVANDIRAVVEQAHKHSVPVKVIFEVHYLSDQQIEKAVEISIDAGADYVKTSTGFAESSATPQAIDIMIKSADNKIKVKAAGGIRTFQQAVDFLDQGVTRLGIGATEAVLEGAPVDENENY